MKIEEPEVVQPTPEPVLSASEEKLYGLVEEIVQLFKPRVQSGEITTYELGEALAVSLSGTIISAIPEAKLAKIQKEATHISDYVLKNFEARVNKRNYGFASQLLGAAQFSTRVSSYGNELFREYQQRAQDEAQALTDAIKES
jgi:hypothetical protein